MAASSWGRTVLRHGLARTFTRTMATGFRVISVFSRTAALHLGRLGLAAASLAATWMNCAFASSAVVAMFVIH